MQAGGKGVNISRAAVSAGLRTARCFPARPDDPFVTELVAAGIACSPAPPAGDVRINLAITEPDGTTTKLNSPGSTVSGRHLDDLAATVLDRAGDAAWVVLAGSLPPGHPTAGTPSWCGPCTPRRPGSRSTPARGRCRPGGGAPRRGSRPDEAQRRGAGVVRRR